MRVCRFERNNGHSELGFYANDQVYPLIESARLFQRETGAATRLADATDLLDVLPPLGAHHAAAREVHQWLFALEDEPYVEVAIPTRQVQLQVPIPRPNKLFLLAGNYAKHIEEGGGVAAERAETFPYVFMKPPTTTLRACEASVSIPDVSPDHIDWELELAVIIGCGGKNIPESRALNHVAGYTIINDISDRRFRPNPERKPREKDGFFDWLHGKWHDGFCPCGPCVTSADTLDDPQTLGLQLRVNGHLHQDSSTAHQIFPVAAVIEFISSFVTLEPGDIISTGTPAGVGNTTGTYLKAGDQVEASIECIGTLRTRIG